MLPLPPVNREPRVPALPDWLESRDSGDWFLVQENEEVGGLGILRGDDGKCLPGDGSEEAEDDGDTEGGGVS